MIVTVDPSSASVSASGSCLMTVSTGCSDGSEASLTLNFASSSVALASALGWPTTPGTDTCVTSSPLSPNDVARKNSTPASTSSRRISATRKPLPRLFSSGSS